MNRTRTESVAIFLLVAAALLALDVASKYLVFDAVKASGGRIEVIPGWFDLIAGSTQGGCGARSKGTGASANSILAFFSSVVAPRNSGWRSFRTEGRPTRDRRAAGCLSGRRNGKPFR